MDHHHHVGPNPPNSFHNPPPPLESHFWNWENSLLDLPFEPPIALPPHFIPSPFQSSLLIPNSGKDIAGPSGPVDENTPIPYFVDGTLNAGDQCNDVFVENSLPCQELVIHGDENQEAFHFDPFDLEQFLSLEEIDEQVQEYPSGAQNEPLLHCVDCQILREIIHTNEFHIKKLEIHGTMGALYHAILLVQNGGNGTIVDQQIEDFSMLDKESIKQFLLGYMQSLREQEFTLVHDSLSAFYDTLCAGMDTPTGANPIAPQSHQSEPKGKGASSSKPRPPKKSRLAYQRERTRKLKITDLVDYFHLPIEVAGERLAICTTVIKKVCRFNGIRRWPYRKVQSIGKKISKLERALMDQHGDDKATTTIQAKIERLRNQKTRILSMENIRR